MVKKILVLLAAVAAASVLLPLSPASASHSVGGFGAVCSYRNSAAYNGARVAVEARGSDGSPPNAVIGARAHVSAYPSCNHAGGIGIARMQIDRLALLSGATVLVQSGSVNNGTADVLSSTAGVRTSCTMNLRVYVHYSARYADNTLAAGDYYGPYFRKPGC